MQEHSAGSASKRIRCRGQPNNDVFQDMRLLVLQQSAAAVAPCGVEQLSAALSFVQSQSGAVVEAALQAVK
jgi:hypothetical protein